MGYFLNTTLHLLFLVLGLTSCLAELNSFSAFPDVAVVDKGHANLLTTEGNVFFVSSQEDGASIHKLDPTVAATATTLTLETLPMENSSKTTLSVAALSTGFGNENLAAASLSSGEILIFDDKLEVNYQFTLDSTQGGKSLVCDGLGFETSSLLCFAGGAIVSLEITSTSPTLELRVTNQYQLMYDSQVISEITSVTFENGFYYFVGIIPESKPSTTKAMIFRLSHDLSQIFAGSLPSNMGDASNFNLRAIPGNDQAFVLTSQSTTDSMLVTTLTLYDLETKQDMTYSLYSDVRESAKLLIHLGSATELVMVFGNSILQFDLSQGLEEKWAKQMLSNNCANLELGGVTTFGSESWLFGSVVSPSDKIQQKSFVEVLKISDKGIVTPNVATNSFHTNDITSAWVVSHDFGETFSWSALKLESTLITKAKPSLKVSTSINFKPVTSSVSIVGNASAVNVKKYLPPTTLSAVKSGLSFLGSFDQGLTAIPSGPSWVSVANNETLFGSPKQPPTPGTAESIPVNVYGVSAHNPLLACATLPIVIETVINNDDKPLAILSKEGVPSGVSSLMMRTTSNGDLLYHSHNDSDDNNKTAGYASFSIGRLYSTGKSAYQTQVRVTLQATAESKGLNITALASVESGFNQQALALSDNSVAMIANDRTLWSRSISKMEIEAMCGFGQNLVVFGSQSYIAFDLSGNVVKTEKLSFSDFTDYKFGQTVIVENDNLFVLIKNKSQFGVFKMSSTLDIEEGYIIIPDSEDFIEFKHPDLIEGSNSKSLIIAHVHQTYVTALVVNFTDKKATLGYTVNVSFRETIQSFTNYPSTDSILVVTNQSAYPFDLKSQSGKQYQIAINTLSCSIFGGALTENGISSFQRCTPYGAGEQLGVVVLTDKDSQSSQSGGVLDITIKNDAYNLQTLTKMKTTFKNLKLTEGTSSISASLEQGRIFTVDIETPMTMTNNFISYAAPALVGNRTLRVKPSSSLATVIRVSDFGSNLGSCQLSPFVQDGVSVSISENAQTATLLCDAKSGYYFYSQVVVRCNTWISSTASVSVSLETGSSASRDMLSVLIFCLVGYLNF